ncbi:N-acetylglucosamine-6-phosphate deacetylase [Conexibacter woesei]|uniref:N-acetylglucosamine-6-phosphate deacetylase n=1 Tax=Conexibacter woesei (strain DSM 14684 / CCUG 47730 / CIP 108061 / JCM 11494 / NBRC 100937 / ID131577) TaxID=469383 RepID=D3F0W2_CONWI|nr:N-acetylglucosamine-6-phosphate deacetylase [Conexibacter woesei]ADB54046.1 N-acetylglucosamine-6-phosphate deacetylase [Conexibacter woesei DSM 14684]
MDAVTLRGGRVVTPGGVVDADVVVEHGRIAAVEPRRPAFVSQDDSNPGRPGQSPGGSVDLEGRWVLPGFVDVHVHGGGGAQFNTADPEEVLRVARFHAQHGTTALLATTVAAPVDDLLVALGAIRTAVETPAADAAELLGIHLEGPFLSRRWPGAMDPGHFLDPDPALLDRLLAGGRVRSISLAPELPGACGLIERAVDAGLLVSLAHSDAGYDDAAAAVRAGARAVTHAFNAMRPLHHRDPGMLGAALDLDELTCEVICDGVHVAPAAVRLLQRLKGPARTALVTDAIEATGLADGEYRLGDRRIAVADGRATLPGAETIAGATLTMDRALRNAVVFCDVSVADAARMAATTPAELLGIADRKGSVAPGRDADLAILEPDLSLAGVMARGAWVRPLGADPAAVQPPSPSR